jgi:curved DNA-binding protein CbpA
MVGEQEFVVFSKTITDLDYIAFKYKKKAKELHPDTGGDAEKFKELQGAYKQLRKELED